MSGTGVLERLALALVIATAIAAPARAQALDAFKRPAVRAELALIARDAVAAHLAGRPYAPPPLSPALHRPAGVFVTYSRDGVTRACWGTVQPRQGDVAREVAVNAVKALTLDYRQAPVRRAELAGLVAHVSIVGPLMPLGSASAYQPRRFGLLALGPGKGAVLLPGEAATSAWADAAVRRKAGLAPRESARYYAFDTAVVGPVSFTELE